MSNTKFFAIAFACTFGAMFLVWTAMDAGVDQSMEYVKERAVANAAADIDERIKDPVLNEAAKAAVRAAADDKSWTEAADDAETRYRERMTAKAEEADLDRWNEGKSDSDDY